MSTAWRHERLRETFETEYEAVMRYALRRTAQLADAEDVAAETFVVAWRHVDEMPAAGERLFWLYGIARRVLANHRRGAQRRLHLQAKVRASPAPATPIDSSLTDVMTAMRHVSKDDQEVLRLVAWEGLSLAEVGLALGITANAAGIRLHRARARLGRAMDGSPQRDVKGFRRIRTLVGWKGSASGRSHREEVP
jgi:RNA polymerase sigma-70 factor (ECF subfamily)